MFAGCDFFSRNNYICSLRYYITKFSLGKQLFIANHMSIYLLLLIYYLQHNFDVLAIKAPTNMQNR